MTNPDAYCLRHESAKALGYTADPAFTKLSGVNVATGRTPHMIAQRATMQRTLIRP